MGVRTNRPLGGLRFALALLVFIASCAGAPVQEMSDARQAIQAAEEAGAEDHAPRMLREAREFLERAEDQLAQGAYREAREAAEQARARAIAAREAALTETRTPM